MDSALHYRKRGRVLQPDVSPRARGLPRPGGQAVSEDRFLAGWIDTIPEVAEASDGGAACRARLRGGQGAHLRSEGWTRHELRSTSVHTSWRNARRSPNRSSEIWRQGRGPSEKVVALKSVPLRGGDRRGSQDALAQCDERVPGARNALGLAVPAPPSSEGRIHVRDRGARRRRSRSSLG